MDAPPTKDQITTALPRAATAIRPHTNYGDRLLKHPLKGHSAERRGTWWLIGHIRVSGEPDEWDVLYDPMTDAGRLQSTKRPAS
ncbi:MAG: hypothetical protein ACJ789_05180 [Thermomicrobiales bacterium]